MSDPEWVETSRPIEVAVERLTAAVTARADAGSRPRVAVSGGSTATALGGLRRGLGGRWSTVRLTWTDERRVDFEDADSNRGQAYRDGHLDPADPCADELPLFLDGERGETAIARVEAAWSERFDGALDVVLLGMGPDGHVASLFPGRAWPDGVAGLVDDSPKPPARRITLSRHALSTAAVTLLLATGEAKREALERLRRGDPALPACGWPGLIVVTDVERSEG